ncbi:hypothetical protein GOODEAATRI_002864, partial [Goodea atripinnis]
LSVAQHTYYLVFIQSELLRSRWNLCGGNLAIKQGACGHSGTTFFMSETEHACTKMSVNVNRSVSDQFYRYKMPRLIAKVEGKGNGIKTVIVNMVEFDAKNDRYIVNGSHEANKLQDMLDGFIRKFVLCPECDNPETDLDRDDDDEDWAEETTEEAQRRRMEEISDHAKNLTLSEDLEKPLEERVNLFYSFVKVRSQKKESGTIDGADKEILAEAERLDVKAMGPLILSELLFNENIRDQIKKYKRHFLRFCHNNKKAQKYLLGGFECVVKLHQVQLLPRVAIILKDLYDADLLEEDVIFAWAERVSVQAVFGVSVLMVTLEAVGK